MEKHDQSVFVAWHKGGVDFIQGVVEEQKRPLEHSFVFLWVCPPNSVREDKIVNVQLDYLIGENRSDTAMLG